MRPALAAILSLAACPAAGDISLVLPVDCSLGETCFIQQTVDHDPGPGAADFRCGSLSYDGHKGTDVALPSRAAQAAGVTVLAAADGTVRGVRDGQPDVLQGSPGAPDVTGVECGNGVVIAHPDGWETQYCHMANGSILVALGDRITAGTPLGQVGLSGDSQFPHLHLSVRRDGAVVDPFAPTARDRCGAPDGASLWQNPPALPPGGVIAAGIASAVPDFETIKAGTVPDAAGRDAPLVAWGYLFGTRPGDVVRLTVTDPAGEAVFTDDVLLERGQAQVFRATGRRAPPGGWPAGEYLAAVALVRDGAALGRQSYRVTLD